MTALLLVFADSSSVSASGGEASETKHYPQDCNPTSVSDAEVLNFHEVDSELFRGGRPHYKDDVYLKLANVGIRTIVNLEAGDQAAREWAAVERVNQLLQQQQHPPLVFISFPIRSFFRTVLFRVPDKSVKSLFAQIQHAPKPIFIHCKHGKDRTGMVVALYRLKRREQPSLDDVLREATHYHFSRWNFSLKRTLKRFSNPERLEQLAPPSALPAQNVCLHSNSSQAGSPATCGDVCLAIK